MVIVAFPLPAQKTEKKLPRTEVLVLVDLSNRIDGRLHPGQLGRDTTVIRMIADEFASVVKQHMFLFSRDRLRVIYVGGEGPPVEPRVDVAKMNEDKRIVVKELPKEIARFKAEATRPFLLPNKNYVGADLWSWFKNSGPSQLAVSDPNRKIDQKIIIITDGYLEFAPSVQRSPGTSMRMKPLRGNKNWEAAYQSVRLAKAGNFPGIKVLMLEVAPLNPVSNTTEPEILRRYWIDWFQSMGMQSQMLTNSEALPSIQDVLHQFLH
jgi:hypothetical protein